MIVQTTPQEWVRPTLDVIRVSAEVTAYVDIWDEDD